MEAVDGHGGRLQMMVTETAAHSRSRAKAARRLRPSPGVYNLLSLPVLLGLGFSKLFQSLRASLL